MYYRHFHLSGPPFEATAAPEALYLSRAHRESLAALEWGLLHEPSGFTTLTGETGTGKTTLVCSILARNLAQLCAAYVINPKLSFDDILRVVNGQFGVPCAGGTKLDHIEALAAFLGRRMPHERLAIIVDEAQDLSDDALEELRLLSNYGQRLNRYLQLVLVGQPELAVRLKNPSLRQFNQRVAARSVLSRLSITEAHEYAGYRLRAKGGRSRDIFDSDALAYLLRHSGGIPRQINVLCHNAMLLAYSAGASRVDLKTARAAVSDHGQSLLGGIAPVSTASTWERSAFAGAAALGMVLIGGYAYQSLPNNSRTSSAKKPVTVAMTSYSNVAHAEQPPPPVKMHAEQPPPQVEIQLQKKPEPEPIAKKNSLPDAPVTWRGLLETEGEIASRRSSSAMPPTLALQDKITASSANHTDRTAVDPESATADAADARRSISVKYGDTLELIALRYLGSRYALGSLIAANPQIADINRIFPGQKVYLTTKNRRGRQLRDEPYRDDLSNSPGRPGDRNDAAEPANVADTNNQ
jgi:type II secretory pathway predicted ATPase ExeA